MLQEYPEVIKHFGGKIKLVLSINGTRLESDSKFAIGSSPSTNKSGWSTSNSNDHTFAVPL